MKARRRIHVVTIGLLLLVAMVGVGFALTDGISVTGTVTIEEPEGPSVDVTTNGGELLLDGPDDASTVDLTHDNGQITFESDGSSSANLDTTEITGTYTRVSGLDATNDVTITPEDKPAVTVGGDIQSIKFGDMAADDGTVDFRYESNSDSSVTVRDVGVTDGTIVAVADDGTVLDTATTDSAETATFDSLEPGSYDAEIKTPEAPSINEASADPSDGGTVTDDPIILSIDVEDADFGASQGDSIEVEFIDDDTGDTIGTDTLASNGTASVEWDGANNGQNNWSVKATDDYGETDSTSTLSFETPSIITLYNETSPDQKITDGNATIQFFGNDRVYERDVVNGTVDMEGLPLERFVIQVEADGYFTRQAIIDSVLDQQRVYLLSQDADFVENRFTLTDPTGQFTEEESTIYIQKPITEDGNTTYQTVAADEFGANGYQTELETDQRYRILVREPGGGERVFSYTAEETEAVELEISSIEFEFDDNKLDYKYDARLIDNTSVQFRYTDETETTQSLSLTIVDRQTGDVVAEKDYFDESVISDTIDIPSAQNNETRTLEVSFEAERDADDETLTARTTIGQSQLPVSLPGVPQQVLEVMSMIGVILVAAMFTPRNASVGGIVTAMVAGMFWLIGWMPGAVSGIFVSLALLMAVLYHAAFTRRDVQ